MEAGKAKPGSESVESHLTTRTYLAFSKHPACEYLLEPKAPSTQQFGQPMPDTLIEILL